jgi:hypothetical protein
MSDEILLLEEQNSRTAANCKLVIDNSIRTNLPANFVINDIFKQ